MAVFSPKGPTEIGQFVFDFTRILSALETIGSATVTCGILDGTDPSASAMVLGSAVVVANQLSQPGKMVTQRIQAGMDGARYMLKCTAVTASQTLVLEGDFWCAEQIV